MRRPRHSAPSVISQAGAPDVTWEERALAGGARLLVVPMSGRPSASVSCMLRVGSRDETPREAGICHFLEHMVFKGTDRYPSGRSVSEAIEGIGGVLNGSTDKEATDFWARVPVGQLERAVDVLLEMVYAARIDGGEVERERRVVLEELRMYRDQPGDLAQMEFDRLMWPRHPLAGDPGGSLASVAGIDQTALRAHYQAAYAPTRLVVSVAGGVTVEQVAAVVEARLGAGAVAAGLAQAAGGPNGRRRAPAGPAGPGVVVRARPRRTEQTHVVVGVRGLSYRDPDRIALDVLNGVLGEGMSSRLFVELREERGLAYDVHSFTTKHQDTGAWAVYLATEPGRAPDALAAAVAEMRRVATIAVGPDELRRAKEYLKGRLLLHMEGTGAVSEFVGQQALLLDTVETPAAVLAAIEAVDADAVRRVAATLLAPGA
ncbi:MAG TPA: pitrilysin family protein, partial [Candidatus Dormibacteraeota bacterium]|nr:pitrilysin family protein [Candidatus Dormibacteraeota bacterium]